MMIKCILPALCLMQSMSGGQAINGGSDLGGLGSAYKDLGYSIAAVGVLCAAISVLRKLANNSDDAKKALISWAVGLAVFLAVWNLL